MSDAIPRRVWILTRDEPYRETEILAVYSSEESAKAELELMLAERTTAYPFGRNYSLHEFEVSANPLGRSEDTA